jgi:hypothetical protein
LKVRVHRGLAGALAAFAVGVLIPQGGANPASAQFETSTPRPQTVSTAAVSETQLFPTLTPSATFTATPTLTSTPTSTLTPSITLTLTPSATRAPIYAAPYQAEVIRTSALFAGPGSSHREINVVYEGGTVYIVERNVTGDWVRVHLLDTRGSMTADGWMPAGYLDRDADLNYSGVTVNSTLPDADPANVDSRTVAQLLAFPVIPTLSPKLAEIYALGQQNGINARAITKVGDSVSANPLYLAPMERTDYRLGPYQYLRPVLQLFGVSAALPSVASRVGMTTYTIFDPMWANKDICEVNETPLACEYRTKKPFAAFILFGANDVRHMTDQQFAVQMRKVVDESLARGIIPVLTTFSADPNGELWFQSLNFNLQLAAIAAEYEVPLINLWSAARALPDYGLEVDRVHLRNWGFDTLRYDTGSESYSGTALHNLLSMKVLDDLRLLLDIGLD